jgi:hypothetical protein
MNKNFCINCEPETHIKRQVTRQDCLPSLLGDGGKLIEIVYKEEKNNFNWPRQDKNLFYWHKEPNELTKEEALSSVLFKSPLSQFQQTAGATHL